MAEMVNIIWNHGDPDIMSDITQLMGEWMMTATLKQQQLVLYYS